MPTTLPPLPPILAPQTDEPPAPTPLVQGAQSLPSLPVPVARRSPEAWAALKGTPAWQVAAARARHIVDDGEERAGRASWLENGTLTEADFDAALDLTLNGSLR